jgi:hypothetical protein
LFSWGSSKVEARLKQQIQDMDQDLGDMENAMEAIKQVEKVVTELRKEPGRTREKGKEGGKTTVARIQFCSERHCVFHP